MTNALKVIGTISVFVIVAASCRKNETAVPSLTLATSATIVENEAIKLAFGTNIDLNNLANYSTQAKPNYILKDNNAGLTLSNAKATLGRVLFYDKSLSVNNTISCGSCHKQAFAFGDTALVSNGVLGGTTERHSMRLVNARFAIEQKFFWNERAASLELQTTQPVRDHAEMGFSGQNGRPDMNNLLAKLQAIGYYQALFKSVYNDQNVTEARLQECLAHFIRSIQSFDSKFDAGRAQVANNNQNFPNFSAAENLGKNLFIGAPVFDANSSRIAGGAGCNACHNAPEFDIDPNSRNNGISGVANNPTARDFTNTRSPSLRDITRAGGIVNGPMMHNGVPDLGRVINHYNVINPAQNTNLDPRLAPNGIGQKLNLTQAESAAIIAFLQTLTGTTLYTDKKWSNPFL